VTPGSRDPEAHDDHERDPDEHPQDDERDLHVLLRPAGLGPRDA
jgi:hypothetical protein